jgi:hypothetical protein
VVNLPGINKNGYPDYRVEISMTVEPLPVWTVGSNRRSSIARSRVIGKVWAKLRQRAQVESGRTGPAVAVTFPQFAQYFCQSAGLARWRSAWGPNQPSPANLRRAAESSQGFDHRPGGLL